MHRLSKKDRALRRVRKQKRKKLYAYAWKLEQNLPAGEKWFRERWAAAGMLHKFDRFNAPVGCWYIADVINRVFKYVIEIDGPYHETKRQQRWDIGKDDYFAREGFHLFRIKDFDEARLVEVIEEIKKLRYAPPARTNWREVLLAKKAPPPVAPIKPFKPRLVVRRKEDPSRLISIAAANIKISKS